jgi:hypothetical protein
VKKELLFILCAFLPFMALAQQGTIKGVVKDDAGNPVPSGIVRVQGTTLQTITDSAGAYELTVPYGSYTILIGDEKNVSATENVDVRQPNVSLNITAKNAGLEALSAGATDIPILSLGDEELKEGVANSVSSLLNASRDAYTSASSYVFSIARFKVRGYDAENFPTIMNGAILTDLANNRSEYNAWSGLNDVTRTRENSFGLAPVNFSFGDIGGANNIDSRASQQRKQLQVSYAISNRTYDNRLVLTYGSGLNSKGWAWSVSYSRRWADEGYIKGTFYDGHSYFASLEKMINPHHSIALTTFGAKTKNGRTSPVIQEMYDLTESHYYNRNWGYQNGKVRNAAIGDNFQPLFILTHDWTINTKSSLETAVSYQFGKNKYSGIDWLNAEDPRPDYYRNLPSFDPAYGANPEAYQQDSTNLANYYHANPDALQIQWEQLYEANQHSANAMYVVANNVMDAKRYGFNTNYQNTINNNLSVSAGLSYQKQDINYYKEVQDLLGGTYFLNLNQFAEQTEAADSSELQYDLNDPNRKVYEGDRYNYDYVAHIRKTGLWGQAIFKYDHVDFFIAAQLSMSDFYRTGNTRNGVFADESYGDSKKYSFTNPGFKGGVTYKINGRNYLYANGAFLSRAPIFENAFVSPRTRSLVVDGLENEKITSVEAGYLFRAPRFKSRVTGFLTQFADATDTRNFYYEDLNTFVNYSMTNIDKRHAGVEIALDATLGKGFSASVVAALGEYVYTDRPLATATQDNKDSILLSNEVVYAKNLHVASGPQQAYTLGLNYRSKKFWFVNVNLNYFDGVYVDFNPVRRTLPALENVNEGTDKWNQILGQEKRDGEFTLDVSGGWSWKLNSKFKSLKQNTFLVFNLGITNILDNQDLLVTGYEQLRFDSRNNDINVYPSKYAYSFGATYFASITLRFN